MRPTVARNAFLQMLSQESPALAQTEASSLGQMVDSVCSLLNGVGFD